MLLMWILYVVYALCHVVLSVVCSLWPPACRRVHDVFLCFCHFLMWCLGSGVVLDFIYFWSLPVSLLCLCIALCLYSFAIILMGNKDADCLILLVFLHSCDCYGLVWYLVIMLTCLFLSYSKYHKY